MGTSTGIEWTDATWNPIRGCTRVSEGCRNCYAEKVAYRFSQPGQPYEGLAVLKNGHASWTGKIEFVEKHLLDPLKWKAPRRIFVNSMSDLFHENVTDEMRDRIFAVMALCPQHTFQVLTKRPERMLTYLSDGCLADRLSAETGNMLDGDWVWKEGKKFRAAIERNIARFLGVDGDGNIDYASPEMLPLPNVWLGVSVENQKAADDRLDYLCELASLGWRTMVSFEPLLGAVDPGLWWLSLGAKTWAIVGGESGPGARPMHPDWARSVRDQCQAAGVPFFFKQWGEWVPFGHECGGPVAVSHDGKRNYSAAWAGDFGTQKIGGVAHADGDVRDGTCVRVGKHAAGALLDGVEWKQFPEVRA